MRILRIVLPFVLSAAVFCCDASADDFPNKPIKIIVSAQVGGAADISTRKIAALASQRLGQPIIIDNRPGASGNIGTALAAQAAPDGYTLAYFVRTTLTLNPHIYANPGFDTFRDFTPIIVSYRGPALLLVKADSPMRSVTEFIRAAKQAPGKLRYASGGTGGPTYLPMERLKHAADIDLMHVPYKGDAQYLPELANGQVEAAFAYSASALPLVRAGKLRILGVSSAKRFALLPEVPAIAETVPGYDVTMWSGMAAPAKTPPERLRKIHAALQFALRSAELKTYFDSLGYEAVAGTPEEAAAQLKADYERDGKIAKQLGLRLE
jgi:tripartite-type tricarboxylate transporter receptor subunit TctC